jgi:hypothetical protein
LPFVISVAIEQLVQIDNLRLSRLVFAVTQLLESLFDRVGRVARSRTSRAFNFEVKDYTHFLFPVVSLQVFGSLNQQVWPITKAAQSCITWTA